MPVLAIVMLITSSSARAKELNLCGVGSIKVLERVTP